METNAHEVKPESLSVQIYEFDDFFTVDIEFNSVVTHYAPGEPDDEALGVDAEWEVSERDVVEVFAELSNTHVLFFRKNEKYSLPRDEILMKLKLAFPNHTYHFVEPD
jgi:hypothetical protein